MKIIKKLLESYIVQVFALALVLLVTFILSFGKAKEPVSSDDFVNFDRDWTCVIGDERTEYDALPNDVEVEKKQKFTLEKTLPSEVTDGDAVTIFLLHNYMRILVDGEVVEEIKYDSDTGSKTPGTGWVFIPLKQEYAGKNFQIEMYSFHDRYSGSIPLIYYGTESSIIMDILKDNLVSIIVCIFLILTGLFVAIMYLVIGKRTKMPEQLFWLGVLSVVFSTWSVADLGIITLFNGKYLLSSQLTFSCLYLAFYPMTKFVNAIFADNKKLRIMSSIVTVGIVLMAILQICGVVDICQWIMASVYMYIVVAAWVIAESIKKITNKERRKTISQAKIYIVSIIILSVTVIIDLARYLFMPSFNSSMFSRFGFLFCFVAFAIALLKDTFALYTEREQIKYYKENALVDALTKCSNRTAFEEDCASTYRKNPEKYGIVVFDLNDLKYFNDKYGHSTGDYYIIVCSEIIQDIFGFEEGSKVYRTGGDEFCAVMKNLTYEKYCGMVESMIERVDSLSSSYFEDKMGIASGYAHYDISIDNKIQDTIRRADQAMYENKLKMKSKTGILFDK